MRAQTHAILTDHDIDAIAARLFDKLCERGAEAVTDPDGLINWEQVTLEIQRNSPPGTRRLCRQSVWRLVKEGKLPPPCHRPNARVSKWRRGDVIAALRKLRAV